MTTADTAKSSDPLILDSVTHLEPAHRGRVVYGGSHGGTYAAYYAAKMGVAAVILNDAGIGRERAGVAGLALLEGLGVPAAAVSHRTGRIGDGQHAARHGILSTVNGPAASHGLRAGMPCMEALHLLAAVALLPSPAPPESEEHRIEITAAGGNGIKVIVIDSMSLVKPEDDGHIVVSASHGALLGGRPETAIKYPVRCAISSDADCGIDDVGITRLPALDARGIAGACVSAFSARIGDGMSIWNDGYVSVVNDTARRLGGVVGQSTRELCAAIVRAAKG